MDSDLIGFSGKSARSSASKNARNIREILRGNIARTEGLEGLKRKADSLKAEIEDLEKKGKDLNADEIAKRYKILSCIQSTLKSNVKNR